MCIILSAITKIEMAVKRRCSLSMDLFHPYYSLRPYHIEIPVLLRSTKISNIELGHYLNRWPLRSNNYSMIPGGVMEKNQNEKCESRVPILVGFVLLANTLTKGMTPSLLHSFSISKTKSLLAAENS